MNYNIPITEKIDIIDLTNSLYELYGNQTYLLNFTYEIWVEGQTMNQITLKCEGEFDFQDGILTDDVIELCSTENSVLEGFQSLEFKNLRNNVAKEDILKDICNWDSEGVYNLYNHEFNTNFGYYDNIQHTIQINSITAVNSRGDREILDPWNLKEYLEMVYA